jgi:hypothetical protein
MCLNWWVILAILAAALGAFAAFEIGRSISRSKAEQQRQHDQKPSDDQVTARPEISSESGDQNPKSGAKIKEEQNQCWGKFVQWVNANDKVVVALSTIVIAAFTAALFFATFALWWAGERHSERALRAYVNIHAAYIDNFNGPGTPNVRIIIKNSGQTPAYNLRLAGRPIMEPFPYAGPFDIPESEFRSRGISGPGDIGTTGGDLNTPIPFTDAQRNAIRSGLSVLYVYGEIRYRDAFGKERWTKYRLVYGPAVGITGDFLGPDEAGNDAN